MARSGGKLALVELFLVVLLVSLGFALGSFNTLNTVQQTSEEPVFNLSCPDPVVKVSRTVEEDRDELRADSGVNNYIQNPETEVNYSRTDGLVSVQVDAVSKPEGMSMRPTIFTENTVLLDEYGGEEIESGQIIRYESDDGGFVIHRVRANYLETQGYLLVKGDNTDSSAKVEQSQVTHVVEGILYT